TPGANRAAASVREITGICMRPPGVYGVDASIDGERLPQAPRGPRSHLSWPLCRDPVCGILGKPVEHLTVAQARPLRHLEGVIRVLVDLQCCARAEPLDDRTQQGEVRERVARALEEEERHVAFEQVR